MTAVAEETRVVTVYVQAGELRRARDDKFLGRATRAEKAAHRRAVNEGNMRGCFCIETSCPDAWR